MHYVHWCRSERVGARCESSSAPRPGPQPGLCGPDHDDALDLCVDGTGIEREQLLDAWRTEEAEALAARQHANSPFSRATPTFTRGGRWTALVTVGGAIIRARQPAMATATT